MLDIQIIRNETERVKAAVARKKFAVDIDELLSVDARRRELAGQVDDLRAENAALRAVVTRRRIKAEAERRA